MSKQEVIHGDCLEILKTLPSREFDAVVTDPPYMVGSISVGDAGAKAGTWADMENSAYWFSAWMRECQRLLKPAGHLLTFGSWRSIPTLIRAAPAPSRSVLDMRSAFLRECLTHRLKTVQRLTSTRRSGWLET